MQEQTHNHNQVKIRLGGLGRKSFSVLDLILTWTLCGLANATIPEFVSEAITLWVCECVCVCLGQIGNICVSVYITFIASKTCDVMWILILNTEAQFFSYAF